MHDEASSETSGSREPASYFVVELAGSPKRYAVCERLAVVEPDTSGGLSRDVVERLFASGTLKAMAIPTVGGRAMGCWTSMMARGQSSDGGRVAFTINNYGSGNDGHDDD